MHMVLCMHNLCKENIVKRTTVMLPLDLKTQAESRAHKLGISLGEFIRVSLRHELKARSKKQTDILFEPPAVYNGEAPSDISEKHDDYLYGEEK